MKVVILGAGVVGIASAWFLHHQGHEVLVIDKHAGAGLETSKANAGQLSFGYTTPWAAPGIPLKAAKWLLRKHSPLIMRPDGSRFQVQWLSQMLANCSEARYKENKARMVRISDYSRAMFAEFQAAGIDYEGRQKGTLQIFRSQKEVDAAAKDMEILAQYGVPFSLLNPQEMFQFEPALSGAAAPIVAALHLPQDQTGDCHLFTTRTAARLQTEGVQFYYEHAIEGFNTQGGKIEAVIAGGKTFTGDAFLSALGAYSRPMLQALHLDIPVYPVKGYSLTLPIIDTDQAPQSTIIDETYKVAITRLNERIRVGGMAELCGYDLQLRQKHRETLELVTRELFPQGGDMTRGEFWCGLRPNTPDSTPIIGKTPYANLFLNTGHGTLGWTMSLGAGRLIADIISGKTPEIEAEDLGLSRYRRRGGAVA